MSILYLECGTTLRSPFNTGIQRVVRRIIENKKVIESNESIDECQLLEYIDEDFYLIPEAKIIQKIAATSSLTARGIIRLTSVVKATIPPQLFLSLKRAGQKHYAKLINSLNHRAMLRTKKYIECRKNIAQHSSDLAGKKIMLFLDSTWDSKMWNRVSELKKSGLIVGAVLYDLIPFQYPQTVEENTRKLHTSWWTGAVSHLDFILCISKSVQHDFYSWQEKNAKKLMPKESVDFFYLGAELGLNDSIMRVINDSTPFFLMVGSIEPRKNHKLVLDAFDSFWGSGNVASLVICANNSWHSDDLVLRIKSHKFFNKHLFLIENASDRDLMYLNKSCRAAIMASYAEGFGLPIVEALQMGAKVICNDIPVFREIGEDAVSYFKFNDKSSLVQMLKIFLDDKSTCRDQNRAWKSWITWEESAQMLTEKVLKLAKQ